jgi:hypothetical protein
MKPPLRTKSVGTKVSEAEFALLEKRARGAGMRLAEWVREALLSAPVEPAAGSGVDSGEAIVHPNGKVSELDSTTVNSEGGGWDALLLLQDEDINSGGGQLSASSSTFSFSAQLANPTQSQTCSAIVANYSKEQMATNAEAWSKGWGTILLGALAGPMGAVAAAGGAILNSTGAGGENELLRAETQKYAAQWQAAGCQGNLPASRFGR